MNIKIKVPGFDSDYHVYTLSLFHNKNRIDPMVEIKAECSDAPVIKAWQDSLPDQLTDYWIEREKSIRAYHLEQLSKMAYTVPVEKDVISLVGGGCVRHIGHDWLEIEQIGYDDIGNQIGYDDIDTLKIVEIWRYVEANQHDAKYYHAEQDYRVVLEQTITGILKSSGYYDNTDDSKDDVWLDGKRKLDCIMLDNHREVEIRKGGKDFTIHDMSLTELITIKDALSNY